MNSSPNVGADVFHRHGDGVADRVVGAHPPDHGLHLDIFRSQVAELDVRGQPQRQADLRHVRNRVESTCATRTPGHAASMRAGNRPAPVHPR
ncbi:hypothetical protein NJ76_02530, partial [Rhodococcus sp. IITR03]